MATNPHSAAGQALGYVYQVGWGLLELARPGPDDFELRLEDVDDVSWHDAAGDPLTALQVKHHGGSASSLTDRSVDLWRTVAVWLDDPRLLDPTGPALHLVTTQEVPDGAAVALLGPGGRDEAEALARLDAVAAETGNAATAAARSAWLGLPRPVREGLVARVVVLARQATAGELADELREVLAMALPMAGERAFLDLLLGWWWRSSVQMLSGNLPGVSRVQLRLVLADLRDRFSSNSLPVTVGYDGLPDTADGDRHRVFAHQLDWIEAGERLLFLAVQDYYRAYAQQQVWVEQRMVALDELRDYEARVVREWTVQFELMRMRLGDDATDAAMRDAGRRLYEVALNQPPSLLRAGLNDPFYARGTHHRLADDGRVGWHPQFAERVRALLSSRVP